MAVHDVRVCYPNLGFMLTLNAAKGRFEGAYAALVNIHLDNPFANFSFVSGGSYGVVVDHERFLYDGCLGSMQRNESDVAFISVPTPVLGPNLTQGSTIGSEEVHILSTYTSSVDQINASVLNSIQVFNQTTSLLSGLTLMSLILLLVSRLFLLCRRKKLFAVFRWAAAFCLAWFVKQFSATHFNARRTGTRLTVLLILVTVFLLHAFFNSMIKTELSVTKKPVIVESYADILDREDVRSVWSNTMADFALFRDAPADSLMHKVWKDAFRKAAGNERRILWGFDSSPGEASMIFNEIFDQTAVFVAGLVPMFGFRKNLCAMASNRAGDEPTLSHLSVDPKSSERVLVFGLNARINDHVHATIARRSIHLFEFGVTWKNLDLMVPQVEPMDAERMRKCMADGLVQQPAVVVAPALSFYANLFIIFFGLLCLSLVVVLLEKCVKMYTLVSMTSRKTKGVSPAHLRLRTIREESNQS